ncbi:MAG: hypothetical protein P0Y56_02805 [Candidatus Andeanibacterium colombiense]|uniref:Uncharacterized protein n=1 Tax=Candidatus Andeanibacterium colombiense TaxID=3121345 RepID=A0AAJ6BQ82_9SPHN|nr:MAG: hypothetical protein P0Y56_02805 [Sphingomonadaceae bacterium]
MSPYLQILWFCSMTVPAYAFFRGAAPERRTAITILIWFLADPVYHRIFGPPQFVALDYGHAVLDGMELTALLLIALRANRLWPLWAAGAQFAAMSGHFAMAVHSAGVTSAYWAVTQLPIFPQLFALVLGTVAHERRLRRIGPYRDWRPTG